MTYELAKQLKEAGFTQTGEHFDYDRCPYLIYPNDIDDGVSQNGCYVPTLSELIEACGDRFVSLNREEIDPKIYESINLFVAIGLNVYNTYFSTRNFNTPEEAVAKLWLELNESKRNTTTRKD